MVVDSLHGMVVVVDPVSGTVTGTEVETSPPSVVVVVDSTHGAVVVVVGASVVVGAVGGRRARLARASVVVVGASVVVVGASVVVVGGCVVVVVVVVVDETVVVVQLEIRSTDVCSSYRSRRRATSSARAT